MFSSHCLEFWLSLGTPILGLNLLSASASGNARLGNSAHLCSGQTEKLNFERLEQKTLSLSSVGKVIGDQPPSF